METTRGWGLKVCSLILYWLQGETNSLQEHEGRAHLQRDEDPSIGTTPLTWDTRWRGFLGHHSPQPSLFDTPIPRSLKMRYRGSVLATATLHLAPPSLSHSNVRRRVFWPPFETTMVYHPSLARNTRRRGFLGHNNPPFIFPIMTLSMILSIWQDNPLSCSVRGKPSLWVGKVKRGVGCCAYPPKWYIIFPNICIGTNN